MSKIVWNLRSGLALKLLGLAFAIAPEPEKTILAVMLHQYASAVAK